jgi:hypothetical protein
MPRGEVVSTVPAMATAIQNRQPVRGAFVSVAEHAARGKAARRSVPRSSHAEFEPRGDRPDPIELLERQAQTRGLPFAPNRGRDVRRG